MPDINSNIEVSGREQAKRRTAGDKGFLGTRGTSQPKTTVEQKPANETKKAEKKASDFFKQLRTERQDANDARSAAMIDAQKGSMGGKPLKDAINEAQKKIIERRNIPELDASDIVPEDVITEEPDKPVAPVTQELPAIETPQVKASSAKIMRPELARLTDEALQERRSYLRPKNISKIINENTNRLADTARRDFRRQRGPQEVPEQLTNEIDLDDFEQRRSKPPVEQEQREQSKAPVEQEPQKTESDKQLIRYFLELDSPDYALDKYLEIIGKDKAANKSEEELINELTAWAYSEKDSDDKQQKQSDEQAEEIPEIDQESIRSNLLDVLNGVQSQKSDQESVRSDLLSVLSGVQSQKEGAERLSNAQARANDALDKIHSLKEKQKETKQEEWTPPKWTSDSQANYSKRIEDQNESWKGWTRLEGKPSTFLDQILKKEFGKRKGYYKDIKETAIEGGATDFDTYDRENFDYSFDQYEDENWVKKKLRKMRNNMMKRFLNPSALKIEGMYVQTKKMVNPKNGKKTTIGRIRYSKRTEHAINMVMHLYDCSIYNVMQLVQLRGGIGIDINGTIAKVDPKEFKLTEDQFIELCRDIVESQRAYGHPMGIVQGKPGGSGVRDDTGKFVVVAKTRCFPLGYIPIELLSDLRESPNSALYHKSEDQIAKELQKEWIDHTYEILIANTGGNQMYQARAIENMVRAMMAIDGSDPATLNIPEITQRQTLMALRVERAMTGDPDIKLANEMKAKRLTQEYDRQVHRFKKDNGTRSTNGQIHAPISMDRRGWRGGDILKSISMLQCANQAAHIAIKITNIPEEIVGRFEQNVAIRWADAAFKRVNPDVAAAFQFTPELEQLSQTKASIEARETAEALYRLGGHDLLDLFLHEVDDSGRTRNRLTKTDLRRFMKEWGIISPDGTITDKMSERIASVLKLSPEQQASFAANAAFVFNALSGSMLGSDLFKKSEASQFVHMSMAEMARARMRNEESYDSSQVAEWARGSTGGEEMIRSLLMTEAGREAFMTQGLTSLGRKSPIEHGMRLVMQKNGLTEFAFRNMINRFPEYGVNKLLRIVPFSNTICYLTSYGIKGVGDLIAVSNDPSIQMDGFLGEEGVVPTNSLGGFLDYVRMGSDDSSRRARALNYQAGSRMSFAEGLRKNLMYDTVMAGGKLLLGALYCGILTFLGGIFPPDEKENKYTWSEWKVGSDKESATPLKWAWFMDDLSGVGLPLGMAWAICNQGGWSPESKRTASAVFINAIANFNRGNVIFDAIDLVNNFDEELDAALGRDVEGYDPGYDEWFMTTLEQGFWGFVGSMTPAFVGELVPWSKSYIFAGNRDAHTAGHPDTYQEYMRKRSAQTNVIQALVDDAIFGSGYKYTEQEVSTMVDPYAKQMYDKFYLELDPAKTDLPTNQAEREAELYARATDVCEWIDDHYSNATEAELDGFILNYDARINCINYCYHMINEAKKEMNRRLTDARLIADNGYIKEEKYNAIKSDFYEERDHYQTLIDDFFKNDGIPWSMPKYIRQETDTETRYVDDQGNPMTFLDTIGPNAKAHAEEYDYGNPRSLAPVAQPTTEGKGYNYETLPYWLVLDENGNPVNDTEAMFENAGNMPAIAEGRNKGKDVQELMWGGQGPNLKDNISEWKNISPDGSPTIGNRAYRFDEERLPEAIKNLDAETASAALGIPSEISDDVMKADVDTTGDADTGGGTKGGNDYSKVYGDKYYGDKYYIKNYNGDRYYGYDKNKATNGSTYGTRRYRSALDMYNPKIYSSDKSVYGGHAAGMSVQHPYRATTTYLRPSFSTKGSREAFERSDI